MPSVQPTFTSSVNRDPVHPRLELAAKVKLRQPSHGANQDLLRRVLGILSIPEHPQGEPVNVALQISHELFDRIPVAVNRLPGKFLGCHQASINDLSVASSDLNVAICASSAPSTSSSATGGACNTKL